MGLYEISQQAMIDGNRELLSKVGIQMSEDVTSSFLECIKALFKEVHQNWLSGSLQAILTDSEELAKTAIVQQSDAITAAQCVDFLKDSCSAIAATKFSDSQKGPLIENPPTEGLSPTNHAPTEGSPT